MLLLLQLLLLLLLLQALQLLLLHLHQLLQLLGNRHPAQVNKQQSTCRHCQHACSATGTLL